jgi:2-oxoglutarate ferredoxin oxidoreductase subunit alpha
MSDFGGTHRYNVTGLFHDMWGFPSNDPQVVYDLMRHLIDKIVNRTRQLTYYKEYHVDDAKTLLISYGGTARSALDFVEERRARGERVGLLELQTLWPFPEQLIEEKCANVRYIGVVEMNMGQITLEIRKSVKHPDRVFLINRLDGLFITPQDIKKHLRLIQGRGA